MPVNCNTPNIAHKWAVYVVSLRYTYTPPNPGSSERGAGTVLSNVNNYEKFCSHSLQQLQYTLVDQSDRIMNKRIGKVTTLKYIFTCI